MAPPRRKKPDIASQGTTRAIDQIRQRYMGERKAITVPEWGDLEVWFGPVTTVTMEQVDERKPHNNLERQLLMLVTMATDKGGKPLFEFGDREYLKSETEFTVLQRVFDFMLSSWVEKAEAEKRIAKDPISDGGSSSPSDSA